MDPIPLSPGLTLSLPEGFGLAGPASGATRGGAGQRAPGAIPMPSGTGPSNDSVDLTGLKSALASQGLVLENSVNVESVPVSPGQRRATRPEDEVASAIIDLGPDEGAAVLTSEDGYYSWHFETDAPAPPSASALRARGPINADSPRKAVIPIPLGTGSVALSTRGVISDFVVSRIQILVFKFAGRHLLKRVGHKVDEKVIPGIVRMDSQDPTAWSPATAGLYPLLPSTRPLHILLFVHGTFSSIIGGFGVLGATPWGRDFLNAARSGYDAVLGFNHPTLTVTPLVNAEELLHQLRAFLGNTPAHIDIICHSRGGLVVRSLVERLAPPANLPWKFERIVFVGAVNGGTELANPQNWRELMQLYTNLAAGAGRLLAKFPATAVAGVLVAELTRSIGLLVQVLASEAIDNNILPGLAAMEPSGEFVTDINRTQPGQPKAEDALYYAITSDFDAKLALASESSLPKQLLLLAADRLIDRLMGESNDLVVNVAAMTAIDLHAGVFVKDTLAFAANPEVYHTNYFLQPKVVEALTRWLRLPAVPSTPPPATITTRVALPPATSVIELPARIDTDFVTLSAHDLGQDVIDLTVLHSPRYLVLEREHEGELLRYALDFDKVLIAAYSAPGETLMETLRLHQSPVSATGSFLQDVMPVPPADVPSPGNRYITMDGNQIVGVSEIVLHATPADKLARLALNTHPLASLKSRRPLQRDTPRVDFATTAAARPVFTVRGVGDPTEPETAADPGTAPSDDTPATVTCHVRAEMNDTVVVNETTSVDVTLSREIIVEALRAVRADTEAEIRPDLPVILEIVPKKNFTVVGPARLEAMPPIPGQPLHRTFDVQATDAGEGIVWVRVRQGGIPFANLALTCTIVTVRTAPARRKPEVATVTEPQPGPQTDHQLTIFELERGGRKYYRFLFDSSTLNRKDCFDTPPITGDILAYTKGLYEDIEKRWIGTGQDIAAFAEELREFGGTLWDQLIPEGLKEQLWQHQASIQEILVFAEEPFIPWELVHLKSPEGTLPATPRFLAQMGLVRWLYNVGLPPATLHARARRCHYVIPRYPHPDWVLPEAQQESQFLETEFQATSVVPHPVPVRTLLRTESGFDLLHFACHGVADSADIGRAELMLEGTVQGANYITERLRTDAITNGPRLDLAGTSPIIVLNACQTGRAGYHLTSIGGFARAFLAKGAGLFVAASWSVGDRPARTFTETLYQRLLAGDPLSRATKAARNAAQISGEATWLAYTVYGNPHAALRQ